MITIFCALARFLGMNALAVCNSFYMDGIISVMDGFKEVVHEWKSGIYCICH